MAVVNGWEELIDLDTIQFWMNFVNAVDKALVC